MGSRVSLWQGPGVTVGGWLGPQKRQPAPRPQLLPSKRPGSHAWGLPLGSGSTLQGPSKTHAALACPGHRGWLLRPPAWASPPPGRGGVDHSGSPAESSSLTTPSHLERHVRGWGGRGHNKPAAYRPSLQNSHRSIGPGAGATRKSYQLSGTRGKRNAHRPVTEPRGWLRGAGAGRTGTPRLPLSLLCATRAGVEGEMSRDLCPQGLSRVQNRPCSGVCPSSEHTFSSTESRPHSVSTPTTVQWGAMPDPAP